jgi:hypothetical protein
VRKPSTKETEIRSVKHIGEHFSDFFGRSWKEQIFRLRKDDHHGNNAKDRSTKILVDLNFFWSFQSRVAAKPDGA